MKRYGVAGIAAAAFLVVGGTLASMAFSGHTRSVALPPHLDRVSSRGVPVTPHGEALATLMRFEHTGHIGRADRVGRLIAVGGRAFYRVETSNGVDCYATSDAAGAVATTIDRFDSLGCSLPTTDRSTQPFPSSDQPLL